MAAPDNMMESVRMILLQVPEILALFIGILVAIIQWRRHTRASFLLLLAFALLLILVIVVEFFYYWSPEHLFADAGPILGNQFTIYDMIMFGRSVVVAAAYILLIFAVYVGRR